MKSLTALTGSIAARKLQSVTSRVVYQNVRESQGKVELKARGRASIAGQASVMERPHGNEHEDKRIIQPVAEYRQMFQSPYLL